jgi:radical SAM protein with 4Fe4S-binding SPASM domain
LGLLTSIKTRYYVPSREDSVALRVWKSATRRRVPDFPKTVQFETHSACNAACVFCPYSLTVASQPRGRMSDELFDQIVEELARHHVRRISPYCNNEPFLDPRMVERLRIIHRRIPGAKIVLTTNGSRLDEATVDGLLEKDALHALYISFQGVEKEGYEATMRGSLVFEKTLANVERLIARWKTAGGEARFKIVVTMVATSLVDTEKAVAFWRARGVQSKWTPLENRGGNFLSADSLAPGLRPLTRYANCTRLFKQAYILWNGDMVLCCTDYTRKVVLGNVADSSIEQVWNSPRAVAIRRLYAEGHMDRIPLCRDCTISDTTGEEKQD